jgi:hypothetical protein
VPAVFLCCIGGQYYITESLKQHFLKQKPLILSLKPYLPAETEAGVDQPIREKN